MASSLSAQAGGRPLFLTKSRFLQALQCPRKLRYAHAREPRTTNQGLRQQLALDGQKMGVYTRLLYPHGTLIGQGHTTNTEALVAHTTSLLQSPDDVTVLEGAVRHGHCLIRADLLHKKSKDTTTHLHLMEVKAKAWDARLTRDEQLCGKRGGIAAAWLPYIQDVAFQTLVLRRAFPQCTIQSSLVLPDKAKRNTSIPGLYGMFATDPSGQVFLPEEAQQRILQAQQEEDDGLLLHVVEIDDLVERVLTSALVFPGSTGEDFCTVVDQWEENIRQYKEEGDTATPTTTSTTPPVIGLHCRDCEYRLPAEPASAHPGDKATVVSGFRKCWKEATGLALDQDYPQKAETLLIDLYAGGRTTTKLMAEKKYQFANVTPPDLGLDDDGVDPKNVGKAGMSRSERQWYQVHDNCTRDEDGNSRDNNKVILDQDYLQKAMAAWQYPYHFIDFETILPALPYTVDKHPFQTLAFQFSHHILHADGRLEHATEFLHTEPGTCPNRPFLDALQTSLGDNADTADTVGSQGTVFRWGSHENTVLAALLQSEAYESTMLASLLTKGDRAMVDLMALVTKCYYVAGSGASSSIKKVLLPTLATSETLREVYSRPNYTGQNFSDFQWWVPGEDGLPCDPYKLLASEQADSAAAEVSHGGDAIVAYHALQQSHLFPEERHAIRAALLRYCELDTLAMVMIMQSLQGMQTPERILPSYS